MVAAFLTAASEKNCAELEFIRQVPVMYSIVSAIYDVPVGEVWPIDKLRSSELSFAGGCMAMLSEKFHV